MKNYTNWQKDKEELISAQRTKVEEKLKQEKAAEAEAKRKKDLLKYNLDLTDKFNTFCVNIRDGKKDKLKIIKQYHDEQDIRIRKYIDDKITDLKNSNNFKKFQDQLQKLFQSQYDTKAIESYIEQINKDFEEVEKNRVGDFKYEFDVFEEITKNLGKIFDDNIYAEVLEEVHKNLEIDQDALTQRIIRVSLNKSESRKTIDIKTPDAIIDKSKNIEGTDVTQEKANKTKEFERLLDKMLEDTFSAEVSKDLSIPKTHYRLSNNTQGDLESAVLEALGNRTEDKEAFRKKICKSVECFMDLAEIKSANNEFISQEQRNKILSLYRDIFDKFGIFKSVFLDRMLIKGLDSNRVGKFYSRSNNYKRIESDNGFLKRFGKLDKKDVTRIRHDILVVNSGEGDCAVYAVRDALYHGQEGSITTGDLRQSICKAALGFMELSNYSTYLSKDHTINCYRNIFSGNFDTFKKVMISYLNLNLTAPDVNEESRTNINDALARLSNKSEWEFLEESEVKYIFERLYTLSVDVNSILNDHSTHHPDKIQIYRDTYSAYASGNGIWLNLAEIMSYMISKGYVYVARKVNLEEGTYIKFKSVITDDEVCIHNDGIDRVYAGSAGIHWQAVRKDYIDKIFNNSDDLKETSRSLLRTNNLQYSGSTDNSLENYKNHNETIGFIKKSLNTCESWDDLTQDLVNDIFNDFNTLDVKTQEISDQHLSSFGSRSTNSRTLTKADYLEYLSNANIPLTKPEIDAYLISLGFIQNDYDQGEEYGTYLKYRSVCEEGKEIYLFTDGDISSKGVSKDMQWRAAFVDPNPVNDNQNSENDDQNRSETNLSTAIHSKENTSKDIIEETMRVESVENESNKKSTKCSKKKQRIIENFTKVLDEYYNKFRKFTIEQIREYGEKTKNKTEGYEYNEISIIAAVMRANEIATGHPLREVQILAILEFLDNDTNKFCQINTGEGKTTITSALAVIRALKGEKVDIITSNQVLAAEAIKDREDFYALFGISVTHNIPDPKQPYIEGFKDCYGYDVVYGTMGAFAYDYLHNNVEALDTKVLSVEDGLPKVRECVTVIIDEADNVILDNYSLVTNQAKPIAGVDQIKFLYIEIWQELVATEKVLKIIDSSVTPEQKEAIKEDLIKNKFNEEIWKQKISEDKRIPSFVHEVLIDKRELLIDNAIKARYDFHLDEDYIISMKEKDGEDNILPLEKEIGVRLQNFIWTDLHPFLQMKHNLHINSCGSLTSVFIPNCVYLKLYKKIYGLTGTLGSKNERQFIYNIYEADSTIIPPFKDSQRIDNGISMQDSEAGWLSEIESVAKQYKERALLFVCDTPKALKAIEQRLIGAGFKDIITYENEGDSHKIEKVNKEGAKPGSIIISTNIGGRGTDIKLSDEVKEKGGLHECTTYLPKNIRTERQAAGRAARSGEKGSAQIIFQSKELEELKKIKSNLIKKEVEKDTDYALRLRNSAEENRLSSAESHLKTMIENYRYFKQFENKYYFLKKFQNTNYFILQDIKLNFGLIYERETKKQKGIEDQLDTFFANLQRDIKEEFKNYNFTSSIYAVLYAKHLAQVKKYEEAKACLEKVEKEFAEEYKINPSYYS